MSIDAEKEARDAPHKAEEAERVRTPERIALRMAFVGWVACALLGFIAGHAL